VSALPAVQALRWGARTVLAFALVVLGAGAAYAYWLVSAGGVAGAAADTLPVGATPAAAVSGSSTTAAVSFAARTTSAGSGGRQITSYLVRRYTSAGAPAGTGAVVTCGSTSITAGTVSCTDPGLADGSYYFTSTPTIGNWTGGESAKSAVALVDTTPPTVSGSRTTPNASGWNSTNVVVSFTASDAGSGTASITYSVDGAAGVTTPGASASVTISTEGTHSVSYVATDNRGNTSTPASISAIRIDKTAPTGMTGNGTETCTGGASGLFCGGGITLGLVAGSDAGSGVASVTAAIDAGTPTSINNSATSLLVPSTAADGAHSVTFVTTDLAGNTTTRTYSTAKSTDNTAPTASITLAATNPNRMLDVNDTVVITFAETGSGIDITKFCPGWTGGTVTGKVTVTTAGALSMNTNTAASNCAANAFSLGTISLGASYVKNNQNYNASFAWSVAAKTLTVTMTNSPSNGQLNNVTSSTPGWTTAPTGLGDLIGNPLGTVTGVSGQV
jgi:hypothetical protein